MTLDDAFLAVEKEAFRFIVEEHAFVRREPEFVGASWLGVTYHGEQTDLQVVLDSNTLILVNMIPLIDGKQPKRFDKDLREAWIEYAVSQLLEELEPSWQRPERQYELRSPSDVADVLQSYAAATRRFGKAVLEPDAHLLARVDAARSGDL